MDGALLQGLADLLWPLLVLGAVIYLLPTVRGLMYSRSFKIKYGDMELSVQEASEQLQRQIRDLQKQVRLKEIEQRSLGTGVIVERVRSLPEAPSSHALWVIDHPENTAHEISALQDGGWEISVAQNTRAAMEFLASTAEPPSIVVTTMARQEGPTFKRLAGLDLVRQVQAHRSGVPVVIYSPAGFSAESATEAKSLGAEITSSPLELLSLLDRVAAGHPTEPASRLQNEPDKQPRSDNTENGES